MSQYLELLEKAGITPNFWCSQEYFDKASLKEVEINPSVFVTDGVWTVFPPINKHTLKLTDHFLFNDERIWSDFPEWSPSNWSSQFLDYEYIYDPRNFLSMEGGNWAVFRKNCRKWPRRFGNEVLRYSYMTPNVALFLRTELNDLFLNWLEGKPQEEEIQDNEVLDRYLIDGKNRKILFHKNRIYGINIWDENYRFINYRYCICRPEEYLSEYMRLLFYSDPDIYGKGKMVNDGGVLDNPNLKKFKDKLNPVSIREVKSWVKNV
jgi:hypothetical protein